MLRIIMQSSSKKKPLIAKKVWEWIKSLINAKKHNISTISQLKVNGEPIVEPKLIAETFSRYFTETGPNTEAAIPSQVYLNPEKYLKNRINLVILLDYLN